jgi:hypothetical protein
MCEPFVCYNSPVVKNLSCSPTYNRKIIVTTGFATFGGRAGGVRF